MAGLQRSEISFRRSGSSGLVWDDKLLSGELTRLAKKDGENPDQEKKQEGGDEEQIKEVTLGSINTIQRSKSTGAGRGFRTGKMTAAVPEPPSPRVSACGFCSAFGKKKKNSSNKDQARRSRPKSGKRRT